MSSETVREWRPPAEEITSYKISVSSKYLDLTKRKLELTRLPRELALATQDAAAHWTHLGVPKAALESLLDAWLDEGRFSWRAHEAVLNDQLPQFRTTVAVRAPGMRDAGQEGGDGGDGGEMRRYRVHFVHKRCVAATSEQRFRAPASRDDELDERIMPLLYIHGCPGSFIEVQRVVDGLTRALPIQSPDQVPAGGGGGAMRTRFHVVAPSIPGFGFSDAATAHDFGSRESMRIFHALMARLGYGERYMVVCSEPGWSIARWCFIEPQGCVGVLLMRNGPLPEPTRPDAGQQDTSFTEESVSDTAPILKRSASSRRRRDWLKNRLQSSSSSTKSTTSEPPSLPHKQPDPSSSKPQTLHAQSSAAPVHDHDPSILPQTRAHALTDSPSGLLASILAQLHALGSSVSSSTSSDKSAAAAQASWTQSDVLTLVMLSWLPGPEAALRWLHAVAHESFSYPPLQEAPSTSSTTDTKTKSSGEVKLGLVLYNPYPTSTAETLVQLSFPGGSIPISWSAQHEGRAGLAPHEHAEAFIQDARDFASLLTTPMPTAQDTAPSAAVSAPAPAPAPARTEPLALRPRTAILQPHTPDVPDTTGTEEVRTLLPPAAPPPPSASAQPLPGARRQRRLQRVRRSIGTSAGDTTAPETEGINSTETTEPVSSAAGEGAAGGPATELRRGNSLMHRIRQSLVTLRRRRTVHAALGEPYANSDGSGPGTGGFEQQQNHDEQQSHDTPQSAQTEHEQDASMHEKRQEIDQRQQQQQHKSAAAGVGVAI